MTNRRDFWFEIWRYQGKVLGEALELMAYHSLNKGDAKTFHRQIGNDRYHMVTNDETITSEDGLWFAQCFHDGRITNIKIRTD